MTTEDATSQNQNAPTSTGSMASEPEPDARYYGASAVDLETLRLLLAQCCPAVRSTKITIDAIRRGEYRFTLPPTGKNSYVRSVTVQPPVTHTGKRRKGWKFRFGRRRKVAQEPWRIAQDMETVIDWICKQTEWPSTEE